MPCLTLTSRMLQRSLIAPLSSCLQIATSSARTANGCKVGNGGQWEDKITHNSTLKVSVWLCILHESTNAQRWSHQCSQNLHTPFPVLKHLISPARSVVLVSILLDCSLSLSPAQHTLSGNEVTWTAVLGTDVWPHWFTAWVHECLSQVHAWGLGGPSTHDGHQTDQLCQCKFNIGGYAWACLLVLFTSVSLK